MKPHVFKTLFQSQFLFDFDDIFTTKSKNICSFYFFETHISNIHDIKTNLNYLSSKVLALYCAFDIQNSVLCLTCEVLQFKLC